MPPERIAEGARDLQALLGEHGFLPGVAGHASAGNLHFMLTPDFAKQEDLDRYEAFMGELVELIVDKYDGSLKAEHGTGINMAPYVEREWGEKATELMWRVKRLADPDGVLSPGVVLNRDPGVHLRNLKTTPPIEESATTCVECGFCEPVCPSRNLTTTPRQRIVLRREMARQPEGSPVQRALLDGVRVRRRWRPAPPTAPASSPARSGSTPASWSRSCAEAQHARAGRKAGAGGGEALGRGREAPRGLACGSAGRWRGGPSAGRAPGPPGGGCPARQRCRSTHPRPAPPRSTSPPAPTGSSPAHPVEALVEVSARAGLPVWIPEDVAGSCCGLPWSSKGFAAAHRAQGERDGRAALALERGGGAADRDRRRLLHRRDRRARRRACSPRRTPSASRKLEILDSVAWAHDRLLPWLEVGEKVDSATVHPTCATRHMGLAHPLRALAAALADDVYVAPSATCCGFAGDRGISHPELTAAATRPQAEELAGRHFDAHLSSNRTCEIGLTRATGEPYESVVCLLERLSRV